MIVLTLRTDKPDSEIGVFDGDKQLGYETWEAHRRLAETLHIKVEATLKAHNKGWNDIGGIVVYKGPGSFTGLRIGISVANALAYSNAVPMLGVNGEKWLEDGIAFLKDGQDDAPVVPEYGSDAHISTPKK